MQGIPAPRRGVGYSGRIYRARKCLDCPATFLPGSSGQKRCATCQQAHERKRSRESQARHRKATRIPQHCADCGTELPYYQGMHSERCETCRPAYWKAFNQERNRERTASGKRKVYDQRYRETSGEQIREASRRYRKAHPETDLAAIHRRRQRRDHGMTAVDRLLSNAYRRAIRHDPCFYCGGLGQEDDHYFPLSKGGTDHWYNLVRACLPCNRSKMTTCGTAFLLAA